MCSPAIIHAGNSEESARQRCKRRAVDGMDSLPAFHSCHSGVVDANRNNVPNPRAVKGNCGVSYPKGTSEFSPDVAGWRLMRIGVVGPM
jgi:hypothetical protein